MLNVITRMKIDLNLYLEGLKYALEEDCVCGDSVRETSLETYGLGGSVLLCYQAWVKQCHLVFIHAESDACLER